MRTMLPLPSWFPWLCVGVAVTLHELGGLTCTASSVGTAAIASGGGIVTMAVVMLLVEFALLLPVVSVAVDTRAFKLPRECRWFSRSPLEGGECRFPTIPGGGE